MMISVIIPCYNQSHYLEECMASVLNQSYANWEAIIVNDGSVDNTDIIGRSLVLKDDRIRYFYQENSGVSSARNFGISQSNGEYILPLDADDVISDDYLSLIAQAFERDSNLSLVYCKAEFFGDKRGDFKLPDYSFDELLVHNLIFVTACFSKISYYTTDGYRSNMVSGFEDWDFWIQLLTPSSKVHRIDKVCFYYRIKESSRDYAMYKNGSEAQMLRNVFLNNIDKYMMIHPNGVIGVLIESYECRHRIRKLESSVFARIRNVFTFSFRQSKTRHS